MRNARDDGWMGERVGKVAGLYAALGLVWWVASGLAWPVVGCGDWGCLALAVGAQVVVTAAVLAAAVPLLARLEVSPHWRVATRAAAVLLVIRVAGEALPSVPSRAVEVLATLTAFATAGTIAAFVTAQETPKRTRVVTGLGVLAVLPVAFAVVWLRYGF